MSINRLRISPTPSNTATITPSITPTITECPGICFTEGSGFSPVPRVIIQDNNNKLVVGGAQSYQGVINPQFIRRITTQGAIDSSFSGGTGFNGNVNTISQQTDGKYIICGSFGAYSGTAADDFIRLNYDGSIDFTFTSTTGFNPGAVLTSLIQSDGKIFIGGSFTSYNSVVQNRLIRLNTDATKDTTFDIGTGFNSDVIDVKLQNDGKLICAGVFTTFTGTSQNRITRLNTDGTRDATFSVGTGFNNTTRTLALQTDGKIIIGGDFTTYTGTSQNRITRLNTDGSRDTSFVIGTGFNGQVNKIKLQSNGKIIVVGAFTDYNGTTCNRIVRLNTDGSIDNTFVSGFGFDNSVNDFTIDSDGYIYLIGAFTAYNGFITNRIVKLTSNGAYKGCTPISITPTPTLTRTPTQTPGITSTPTNTPTNTITSTPTQTPCINCYEYSFTASTSGLLSWLDCDGIMTDTFVNSGDTYQITCIGAREGSVSGTGTIVQGALCSSTCITPTPTASQPITPSVSPTNTQTPSISPTNTTTPTMTSTSTTPTVSSTPTLTPEITSTPTNTPSPSGNCPYTIYSHGAIRATCSDYCNENYLIQTTTCSSQPYGSLSIGDFIYGYAGQSGYIAYSNVSTDTTTGPFRIADIDGSGEILGIYVCSGGSCIPL